MKAPTNEWRLSRGVGGTDLARAIGAQMKRSWWGRWTNIHPIAQGIQLYPAHRTQR